MTATTLLHHGHHVTRHIDMHMKSYNHRYARPAREHDDLGLSTAVR